MFQEVAEDHRIADIADEKLVETEHARLRGEMRSNRDERILMALEFVQLGVHAAHETMEVQAQLRFERQRFEEQVDQKRLAAADRAVKVQALRRRRRTQTLPPARVLRRDQFGADAIEMRERCALRRIVVPAFRGHTLRIAFARRERADIGAVVHAFTTRGGKLSRTWSCTIARSSIRRRWKK